jgi:putative addiction module CopG family antidote
VIATTLPPELNQFVERQIAAGRYDSADELLVDAVRVLRQWEVQQEAFHGAVRQGMDQLARGEYREYDDEGLAGLFDVLKQRAG